MIGYIYKLTNEVNGKVYIGKTINITRRLTQHTIITPKYNHHLGNAIKKYGINSFQEDVLVSLKSDNTKKLNATLSALERFCIKKFDTYNNGYNSTIGGEGTSGFKWSQESKKKLSNSLKSYFQTEVGRKHIQKCINSNKGRIVSESTREKIGIGNRGKIVSLEAKEKIRNYQLVAAKDRYKPVIQLDMNNNIIAEYVSITEASKQLLGSSNYTPHITSCCKGTRKSAYGYKWRYKEASNGK